MSNRFARPNELTRSQMSLPNDREIIIARAIAGDMSALEFILSQEHTRLTQYVRAHLPAKLCGSIDLQDIVQDTYFEACRLIGGFENKGPDCIYRWLVTIARHRIAKCSIKKRPQRIGEIVDEDEAIGNLLEQLSIYRRTPSRSAASHEFMARLETTLAGLPANYREVVTHRHINGLSTDETALRMNLSVEAVYVLCCRALKLIREELKSASRFS